MLSHVSAFVPPVASIICPIVVMLTRGKDSPYVRDQAVEALNFHISLLIVQFASLILILLPLGVVFVLGMALAGFVYTIVATIATGHGVRYRYPSAIIIRMVK